MSTSSNARIAKNTIFLYIRMLFVLVVSLYTSRVVLAALGELDYGIQNVVGGFIGMLAFLSSTVSSALSRYFAFEIGRSNIDRLNQYFVLSFIAFILISICVVLFAETFGIWFIENKLIIPEERMGAAMIVFQFSVLSFLVSLYVIPYQSLIIAEEKMNVYAYAGIIDVSLKLLIVYLLAIGVYDKLKLYAILLFASVLISQSIYVFYCVLKFNTACKLRYFWDKKMFKNLMSFSGWTLFGTLSDICKGQGLNILLNMFFLPVVNAARGIAYQVNNAVNHFVTGFFTACRPQITKLYAQENIEGMMQLVFRTSRLSYYLIIALSLPILIETEYILTLWLGKVPDYTVIFTKLVIINAIIDSLSYPFQTAVASTGNIKSYQIITGGLIILTLPISYFILKLGCPPQSTLVICIVISVIAQFVRVAFMKRLLNMSICAYITDVLARVFIVTVVSGSAIMYVDYFFICDNLYKLLLFGCVSIAVTGVVIYFLGINRNERNFVNSYVLKKMGHK